MSESKLKKLAKLRDKIDKLDDTMKYYHKLFMADGRIDQREQDQLDRVNAMIVKIKANIKERESKLNFGEKVGNTINKAKEAVVELFDKDDVSDIPPPFSDEPTPDTTGDSDDTNTGSSSSEDSSSSDDTTTDTEDMANEDNDDSDTNTEDTSSEDTPTPQGTEIQESVGKKGENNRNDVLIVQKLLKEKWDYDVAMTGEADDKTITAIAKFQHRYVGMINKQDAKIDAGGNSWKYLTGQKTPVIGKQEDGTYAGAETEMEKKLAEFAENVGDIQVEVAPGEFVGVRPPYHQNNHRQRVVNAARAKNSTVNAVINKMGWNDKHGKATPKAIKDFLEACIAKGAIADKTSMGMNQFLDKYGISLDCSGLAIQAVNYMEDGNMDRDSNDAVQITNARNIKNYGTKVNAPKDLKAGDMMVINSHVRLIIDVDIDGNEVQFTTVESGASVNLGYGDGKGDSGDGVGQRRWRFQDKTKFAGCQMLKSNKWVADSPNYVYRRIDAAARTRINNL